VTLKLTLKEKKYPGKVISSTIQGNINFYYMFRTEFVVEKNIFEEHWVSKYFGFVIDVLR